jgi:23S rRNA (adenine2030-N6)-methyltransferase
MARAVDRMVLCELNRPECDALRALMSGARRCEVRCTDGYGEIAAVLPPTERRALVLIDPPYEAQDEFTRSLGALREGLRRLAGGVFAIWYPLTGRAGADDFLTGLRDLAPLPVITVELTVASGPSQPRLAGCGLAVVNPPWRFDEEARGIVSHLAGVLALGPGAAGRVDWIVPPT